MRIPPSWLAALLVALLRVESPREVSAQDLLPLVGGNGGNSFSLVCPNGFVLTGIRARRSLTLDGIGSRCRPVRANGTLGAEADEGPVWGGPGGDAHAQSCGGGAVIAQQTAVFDGARLSQLAYHCFRWNAGTRRWDASDRRDLLVVLPARAPPAASPPPAPSTATRCPAATRPADGLRGRAGMVVESIGIRCDDP